MKYGQACSLPFLFAFHSYNLRRRIREGGRNADSSNFNYSARRFCRGPGSPARLQIRCDLGPLRPSPARSREAGSGSTRGARGTRTCARGTGRWGPSPSAVTVGTARRKLQIPDRAFLARGLWTIATGNFWLGMRFPAAAGPRHNAAMVRRYPSGGPKLQRSAGQGFSVVAENRHWREAGACFPATPL
jgi:hypothetical protein